MQHTSCLGCSRGSALQSLWTLLASGTVLMAYPIMVLAASQG